MSSNSRDGSTRVRFWPRRAGSNAMTNLLWPGLLLHRLVARRRPHILNPASPGRSLTLLRPCTEIFTRPAGVRATIRGRVVRSELETEEDSEPGEPYRATCAGAHDDRDPCDLRGRLQRRPLMTDPSLQRPGETDRGGGAPPGGAMRGREPELRAVLELVRGAAKGHGGALLIEGEVGAGKSLLLFDLLEREGATRMGLQPLGDDTVTEMITDALGAVPDPGLLTLAAGAGGNPLLLAELVRGLLEENAVIVRAGRARLRSAHVPRRIQATVGDTLDGLGGAGRQLMQTAAVLGRSFRLEDAATMLGTSAAALLPAVDEALTAGLLVAAQDALTFRHEMVWQAVSESLPQPVRQALHRQIGEILLARGGSAASAAAHLLSAARSGDREALAGLDRAAAEVLPSSPTIAANLATRALELTAPGDTELIQRSLAAAEALTAAGRLEEATRLSYSALTMPLPAATSARLRCALSSALWMSGHATEAMIEAMRVLAQPWLPGELRADAKIALLEGMTGMRDNRRAGSLAESILAASEKERTDVGTMALLAQAVITWDKGQLAEALDLSAEAVRRTAGLRPGARQSQPQLFQASRLADLRRFEEARSAMRAAADQSSPPGLRGGSATPATLRARMSLAAGRLDDAIAEADLSMAIAYGSRLPGFGASAILATVDLRRGDLNAAAQHMESAKTRPAHLRAAYADTWDTI